MITPTDLWNVLFSGKFVSPVSLWYNSHDIFTDRPTWNDILWKEILEWGNFKVSDPFIFSFSLTEIIDMVSIDSDKMYT